MPLTVLQQLIIIVATPLLVGLIVSFVRREKLAWLFSLLAVTISLLFNLYLVFHYNGTAREYFAQLYLKFGKGLYYAFLLDNLSLTMSTLTAIITWLVIFYSRDYMSGDSGYRRYYVSMLIFFSSMMGVAYSGSLLTLLVFWIIMGFSSFLLIGHWYQKYSARRAARIAIATTGIGDVLMILAVGLLIVHDQDISLLSPALPILPLVLLVIGAATKSAQLPFHIWLLEAMEGPTTVSALLHSATMVAAGAFLLLRLQFSLIIAHIGNILLVLGIVTMFYTGLLALREWDSKKILAYSTISNLGLMFTAIATTLTVSPGFVHLFIHAFFKASLFLALAAGIHALGTTDIRLMGGLRKVFPLSYTLALFAGLAQVGLPFYGTWYSHVLLTGSIQNDIISIVLILDTVLSALYISRWIALVYHDESRWEKPLRSTETPIMKATYIALIFLIILSPWIYHRLMNTDVFVWDYDAVISSIIGVFFFVFGFKIYSNVNKGMLVSRILSPLYSIEKGVYWLYLTGVPRLILAISIFLSQIDQKAGIELYLKSRQAGRIGVTIDSLRSKVVSESILVGALIILAIFIIIYLSGG